MNNFKEESLWRIMQRIDGYYSDTNNKSNFLLVFNVFIIGSLILKFNNILNDLPTDKLEGALIVIFTIIALGNFLSIYFIFRSTTPYLESGNRSDDYCSVVYFNSIAEVDCEEYLKKIDNLEDNDLEKDIKRQIHVLSVGLKDKMKGIKYAFNVTLWMVLFPLLIISLFLLFQSLLS